MLLLFVPKNILQILSIDQACYVSGMIVGSIPGTDRKKPPVNIVLIARIC